MKVNPELVEIIQEIAGILEDMEPTVVEAFLDGPMIESLGDRHGELCNLHGCGSPIEQLFLIAVWGTHNMVRSRPQFQVICNGNHYRPDFKLILNDKAIFVECDGHDFHEKTKEQAARDKARDRDFRSEGHTIIHFTGSEIWKDANSCAEEAVKILKGR